jgi:hypothetical protein
MRVQIILRMKVAWILRRQRLRAGLSLKEASNLAQLPKEKVRSFEIGLVSPPLYCVARLLRAYNADENAILFFCCQPMR